MSNHYTRVLLTGSAVALTMVLTMTASLAAATTWTVKPGGTVTATSKKIDLEDLTTGSIIACHTSVTITLKSGGGLPGNSLGSISKADFSKCVGALGITYTLTASHLPWHLNAGSYNSNSGTTHATITGIHAAIGRGFPCIAILDGTGASKDDGTMSVTYKNGTHLLSWAKTGGNLHFYKVQACSGLINSGDRAALAGPLGVSPPQSITSP
jgi:hypothetical protein